MFVLRVPRRFFLCCASLFPCRLLKLCRFVFNIISYSLVLLLVLWEGCASCLWPWRGRGEGIKHNMNAQAHLSFFGANARRYVFSLRTWFEPKHNKSYNNICVSSEDSDQTAHPRSLIWVFADRICLLHPPSYPKRDKRKSLPYWVDRKADLSLCWSAGPIVGYVKSSVLSFCRSTGTQCSGALLSSTYLPCLSYGPTGDMKCLNGSVTELPNFWNTPWLESSSYLETSGSNISLLWR